MRELESLRELTKSLKESAEERNKENLGLEKKLREALLEVKTLKQRAEEDSTKFIAQMTELSMKNKQLETKLAETAKSSDMLEMESDERSIIAGLDLQVASLGQQLLKKETAVLELQAERAALKSRLQDMQIR